jgi:hypothetical protein
MLDRMPLFTLQASPAGSLYSEAGELYFYQRRKIFSLQYAAIIYVNIFAELNAYYL